MRDVQDIKIVEVIKNYLYASFTRKLAALGVAEVVVGVE